MTDITNMLSNGAFLICPSVLQKPSDILKDLAKFKTASHVDRHKLKVVFKQTKNKNLLTTVLLFYKVYKLKYLSINLFFMPLISYIEEYILRSCVICAAQALVSKLNGKICLLETALVRQM